MNPVLLVCPNGSSISRVSDRFYEQDLIRDPLFVLRVNVFVSIDYVDIRAPAPRLRILLTPVLLCRVGGRKENQLVNKFTNMKIIYYRSSFQFGKTDWQLGSCILLSLTVVEG